MHVQERAALLLTLNSFQLPYSSLFNRLNVFGAMKDHFALHTLIFFKYTQGQYFKKDTPFYFFYFVTGTVRAVHYCHTIN